MSWWVTFYLNQIAIGNEHLPIIVTGIEEGVLYYRIQLRPGAGPPLGLWRELWSRPCYRIRKEQKGGKPTSVFPQLIHGFGARSNIFHNHFLRGNLLNIRANSTAMSSRSNGVIQNKKSMTSSFPEMYSIPPYSILIGYFYKKFSPFLLLCNPSPLQNPFPLISYTVHVESLLRLCSKMCSRYP